MTIKELYIACNNMDGATSLTIHYDGIKEEFDAMCMVPRDLYKTRSIVSFHIHSENHTEVWLGKGVE